MICSSTDLVLVSSGLTSLTAYSDLVELNYIAKNYYFSIL